MLIRSRASLPVIAYLAVIAPFAWYHTRRALILMRGAKASMRWRPVDGEIIWSMVEERNTPWYARRRRRNYLVDQEPVQYRPVIRSRYQIGTRQYEGQRVYFGADEWLAQPAQSQGLTALYPLGKKVRVFVDPARPTETVLERARDHAAKRSMWWALLYCTFTALFLWAAFSRGLWS